MHAVLGGFDQLFHQRVAGVVAQPLQMHADQSLKPARPVSALVLRSSWGRIQTGRGQFAELEDAGAVLFGNSRISPMMDTGSQGSTAPTMSTTSVVSDSSSSSGGGVLDLVAQLLTAREVNTDETVLR